MSSRMTATLSFTSPIRCITSATLGPVRRLSITASVHPSLFAKARARSVPPASGDTERARAFAKRLGCTLAVIDKRRTGPNVAEVMHLIGDVKDKVAVILDDMIDTAGTLTQAAGALKLHGATRIYACATHGVLSGPALDRINDSAIEEVLITDTIPLPENRTNFGKIKVLTVSELLAEAIRRIHEDESVSSLFV